MKRTNVFLTGIAAIFTMQLANAAPSITVPMFLVDAKGQTKSIGTVKAEEGICGVLLTPDLHDLSPGMHGFHVHQNPACDKAAAAAGPHLDPAHSDMHRGPYHAEGHLGDLPVLVVDKEGRATTPALAPRFKLSDLTGHSLVIHAGGDNYADTPEKLGGGGARIACGVIGEIKS
jgi:Cu-Zn family superoxide dismutase